MLENARRQAVLVLLVAVAALISLTAVKLRLGLDLSGGTQLIYEVDIEKAKRDELIPKSASQSDIDAVMNETVAIIAERIDPQGTTEAVVTRRGDTGILVELPKMSDADADAMEARIRELGRLEMRIVVDDSYSKGDVRFQLNDEKQRLQAWLDASDGANRKLVAENPERISDFNILAADQGGSASPWVRWFPKVIRPSVDDPNVWSPADYTQQDSVCVPAFAADEWNGGMVAAGREYLVEFMPVNMHEQHFTGEHLDPSAIRRGLDEGGRPAIMYRMKPSQQDRYADWSGEYTKQRSAIILNGEVYSAPVFQGRILGNAQITGRFSENEADELVAVLRTGSLKVQPNQLSKEVIGATLGQKSIDAGILSIAIGGALVLLFILFYYRRAGLVAFAALAINILLILGVLKGLRATLTLPGIAGLVLTMGMAIDANILIYERIREELGRGKAMLQACRAGFDRAIVTVLDANITTFIAGLVLYLVGVGPIRGFAVTLMIGILTTLFTAFFVSRLIFHYMLQTKKLEGFRFRAWIENLNIDFLSYAKGALFVSAIVVLSGIAAFLFVVPFDRSLGLDFKGGANLKVSLVEPSTRAEIRDVLLADPEFRKEFPDPIVNTIDPGPDNRSTRFSIKLKLSDALREQIDAARLDDPDYEPPYLTGVARILEDKLVSEPYSATALFEDDQNPAQQFAEIELHFAKPVRIADVQAKLDEARFVAPNARAAGVVSPETAPETAKDIKLEFKVASDVQPAQLFELSRGAIAGLADTEGRPVELSDPIPESSQIGGRMVGELRNAAIGSLIVAMFLIVMFIRIRFHEYKYGLAAVAALVHDVLVTLGVVVVANYLGMVDAEIGLAMIAAFLTIIGYSINDTIVIFDRVREMLNEQTRLGEKIDHADILNGSINRTLSRTILTSTTTMFVVVAQFVVNRGTGTPLEGFSFALIIGLISGTYSTVFIASPIMLWLWKRERGATPLVATAHKPKDAPVATTSSA